ncbi:hypothetical protein LV89_00800 [Arcicella aurantiaca]|uniref:Uncharacterized protein n=1 Tax=Arcicella aurantiaca TaxID=591202 RepID=A0A316EDH9_9BACT|nr:hypothetical protein [Arcicella aurantiaca]PWK28596.1 hypothetical protein LV89_00800 [Arcicella aurantiaca]
MRTHKKYFEKSLCYIFIIILFNSCSSGMKQLQKGNFDEAVFTSVERLQKSSDNSKALAVLHDAYPLAVENHKRTIRNFENSHEPFRWEKALAEYQQLNKIHDMIARSPVSVREVGMPQNYINEVESARKLAADERYQAGMVAMNSKENRLAAKDAIGHFQRVNELMPNYKDINQQLDLAYQYATYRVIIEPVHDVFRLRSNEYQILQEAFNREIFRSKLPSQFVKYYTTIDVQKEKFPIHEIVKMSLVNMSLPIKTVNSSVENFTKSVKTGTKKNKDSTVVDIYKDVTARITTYTKTIVMNGTVELKVFDYRTNNVITQEVRNEAYTWTDSWQKFEGNPEALNGKKVPTATNYGNVEPSEITFFTNISNQFANYFQGRLRKAYRDM